MFWGDDCAHGVLAPRFPRCYSFAKSERLSVKDVKDSENLLALSNLPLSAEAFHEFQEICDNIYSLDLVDSESDSLSCSNDVNSFSSKRFHGFCFKDLPPDRVLGWIWKSKCVPKLKVFFWLLLNDRVNTFDMMDRRHCKD